MINSLYFASFKIAKEKKSWERLMLFKSEPILISKGWKIRAVLVTPEDFETRFLIPILNAGILRHPMTEDLALKANRFVKKGLKINQIFFSKSQDMYNF